MSTIYRDRRAAGEALASHLGTLRSAAPLVLALPRGGVPVAYEIAKSLDAELDVLLVRKIGAPTDREFGLGAVADAAPPIVWLDEELVRSARPAPGYVDAEVGRELIEMARRRNAYVGDRARPVMAGRTVLVVDDGVATGGTSRAALSAVRQGGAAQIILVVPVGAASSLERLRNVADMIVCPLIPKSLTAVGRFYRDFRPTEDEEVVRLLAAARDARRQSVG